MKRLILVFLISFPSIAFAQLTGSVESSTIFYVPDGSTGADSPQKWGSNNYLKLDYTKNRFSAGMQMEYYPMPLQGYAPELKGFGVPVKFINWTDEKWNVTAGDFYGQFGSGLVFRSWEDRQLGFNNSILGIDAGFHNDFMEINAFYGIPRYYLKYVPTQVGGVDMNIYAGEFCLGASFVSRIDDRGSGKGIPLVVQTLGLPDTGWNGSWSGRIGWNHNNLSINAEYVGKMAETSLVGGNYQNAGGNAELLEINWFSRNVSARLTARRLVNMESHIFKTTEPYTDANILNYLPSLAQEQVYMLASLNPYITFGQGEAGTAGDIFWKKDSWRFHIGGALIYGLPNALPHRDKPYLAYRELNADIEKKWSPAFRTILFVSIQEKSPTHGDRKATEAQNAFVLDALYKFSPAVSLRGEIQYLYSAEREKDWMAVLAELSFAGHWSLTASDMYNHGSTKVHYYSLGAAYRVSSLRVAFEYGLHKDGFICSGGVCRYQRSYKGGNLMLTYSF